MTGGVAAPTCTTNTCSPKPNAFAARSTNTEGPDISGVQRISPVSCTTTAPAGACTSDHPMVGVPTAVGKPSASYRYGAKADAVFLGVEVITGASTTFSV